MNQQTNFRIYAFMILFLAIQYGFSSPRHSVAFVSMFKIAQDVGDPSAQFVIGHMYATGQGTNKDIDEAIFWYRKAGKQGHSKAQLSLGKIYKDTKKYQKALIWLEMAAEKNLPEAHYLIAQMVLKKLGMKLDYTVIKNRLLFAAALDYPKAYMQLAHMYEKGEGVKQSYPEALLWYEKADYHNIANAQFKLGRYHLYGLGVSKNKQRAILCFKNAALNGSEQAYALLTKLDPEANTYLNSYIDPVNNNLVVFAKVVDKSQNHANSSLKNKPQGNHDKPRC